MPRNYYEEMADFLCGSLAGGYTNRQTILRALRATYPDETSLRSMREKAERDLQRLMDEAAARSEVIGTRCPFATGQTPDTLLIPEG